MNYLRLDLSHLLLAATMVVVSLLLSYVEKLRLGKALSLGAVRATVQLLLVGFWLQYLFHSDNLFFVLLTWLAMLLTATLSAWERLKRRSFFFSIFFFSMATSSLLVVLYTLQWVLGLEPWFAPQYSVPLAGMVIGYTLNAVTLVADRLESSLRRERSLVEAALALGATPVQAAEHLRAQALQAGMIPLFNYLSVVGIVQLPGMMTGQLIAGALPIDAVRYQILISFMLCPASLLACLLCARLTLESFFNERMQLTA